MCDLLWSDPEPDQKGWGENERGVSYTFGPDVLSDFIRRNNIDIVVRAHQVVEEGYEFFHKRALVTIFSVPDYCGEFDNRGAVMLVDENLVCSFKILESESMVRKMKNSETSSSKGSLKKRPSTPPKLRTHK